MFQLLTYRQNSSLLLLLLLLLLLFCLLSQAFSPCHFSSTSCDPHRSRFKFQTAALSILCVMFQVQLSFVVNLLNVFLVSLPHFSLNFLLLFQLLHLLPVWSYTPCSKFATSLYINSRILVYFLLPILWYFCRLVLSRLSICTFSLFIIISGLFATTSLSLCTSWFHRTFGASCSHTGLGVRSCTTFLFFDALCFAYRVMKMCINSVVSH